MFHPDWFKIETGFKFFDPSGDLCVILGTGGYRTSETVPLMAGGRHIGIVQQLVCKPMTSFVYACLYKGEWFLFNLNNEEHDEEWWSKVKPFSTEPK